MIVAAASLALCVVPSLARLSIPAGAAGAVFAVCATILAQRRSSIGTILGLGAAVTSILGIAVGVSISLGVLPGSVAYSHQQLARNLPTARAGDVEVRVRSAEVLHPVLIKQTKQGPTAETYKKDAVLRLEVELRNNSDHTAQYTSWASASARADGLQLQDESGNRLQPLSAANAVPLGRVTGDPVTIKAKGGMIADVLLFEAPPKQTRELDLELPGGNIGSTEPLQIHIPAEMFARQ